VGEAVHRFNAEAELVEYRDHLEELVLRRTNDLRRVAQELARSNMDLEQYAYVVSHDLQEPLRAVDGFVALLRRKYRGQLDAEANSFIDSAVEGVQRMQSLIRDLLAYARATPRNKPPTPTDVRRAVADALENLRTSIAEAEAVVTVDRLPRVYADRGQLAQLFQNLIGNAIKFRGDRRPEIRIEAERQQDAWLFSVRDNGIGIDPQHAERVFLIFQRLHKRSQYPGTGIGLAICKKIVEHYGGKIWVESQSGHGATFYFTLPAKDDESVRTPRSDEEKCSKT
jgi:chemotaxis family two-component system sensor kinase Cph1